MLNNIGVLGLGVMGKSIAKNLASHEYKVAVYNKTFSKTEILLNEKLVNIYGYKNLGDFIDSLEKPRKILLMVSANAVDDVISQLLPLLDKTDILIDGGNSFYKDSERRMNDCKEHSIQYIGMGISGGEYGALHGPSLMPSGDLNGYNEIKDILMNIAAKNTKSEACVTYIGESGSGHFVKMVHNGIEYADMQLISEIVGFLRKIYSHDEVISILETWNKGRLKSYLLEITIDILKYKENDVYLLDKIDDKVNHKGTGKWSSLTGIEIDVPIPSLIEALQARYLTHSQRYNQNEMNVQSNVIIDEIESAFYLSKIMIYNQGFDLIKKVSNNNNWNLNLSEIARIWQAGCIIQSTFIEEITEIFKTSETIIEYYINTVFSELKSWRKVSSEFIVNGHFSPVLLSALSYFEGISHEKLSTNLIQAQRDYFGAHTYSRIDKEGAYHTNWKK